MRKLRVIWSCLTWVLLFWPAILLTRAGIAILRVGGKPVARFTIRPLFRLFCCVLLYARPLLLLRQSSQHTVSAEKVSSLLENQKIIAVIPCACRAGRARCSLPLHKPHDRDTCISLGLAAVFQVGSGLGRRIDPQEAHMIFARGSRSGLVPHVLYSLGSVQEICNCCPETCAAIMAYKSGIPEAIRPSEHIATRGSECSGCSGRSDKVCADICPYGKEPSTPGCLGCGLCAMYCPEQAVHMFPRRNRISGQDA